MRVSERESQSDRLLLLQTDRQTDFFFFFFFSSSSTPSYSFPFPLPPPDSQTDLFRLCILQTDRVFSVSLSDFQRERGTARLRDSA